MGKRKDPLGIICEFLSPFETNLNVFLLGEFITKKQEHAITKSLNDLRNSFNKLPGIKPSDINPMNIIRVNSSELFRGGYSEKMTETPGVIVIDKELSKSVIALLINETESVDPLDEMLLEKYLISVNQEKFVLDLSDCSIDRVNKFTINLDLMFNRVNYALFGEYIAIWLYKGKIS